MKTPGRRVWRMSMGSVLDNLEVGTIKLAGRMRGGAQIDQEKGDGPGQQQHYQQQRC